jgi:hypothetical protein
MPDTAALGFVAFRRPSCGRSDHSRQPDEIVGGHRPNEFEVELLDAAQHGPSQPEFVLPQPNGSSTRLRFCWLIS